MLTLLVIVLGAYLVGAVPAGLWLSRWLGGIDIRTVGSGNPGLTNVWRTLGWPVALPVGVIDFGKGLVAPLWIAEIRLGPALPGAELLPILAGFCAVAGHVWSVFARFRGGKGVLTSLGMMVGLAPVAALISFALWGLIVTVWRYVSLGSVCAAIALPLIVALQKWQWGRPVPLSLVVFTGLLGVLIVYTHRSNIVRLLHGTEHRITRRRPIEA